MADRRVVFTPSGRDGHFEEGITVLDAARHLGVDLDSVCGGRGICGRCQVTPSIGSFAKWGFDSTTDALTEWTSTETDYKGRRKIESGNRLGCAAHIVGDVVIDVPAASQVHKQVVRKSVDLDGLTLDPIFSLAYVELPSAELGDDSTMEGLVAAALAMSFGFVDVTIDPRVLPALHPAAANDQRGLTVAVRRTSTGPVVSAAWKGFIDVAYGIAVDVGSTTVAAHLVDLATGEIVATAGRMNPQIRFGEDLMSRVSYVMMNPGGEVQLTNSVRTALDELAGELVASAEVSRDRVLDVVLVGNPVMHHIMLGINPTPLGAAPFILATDRAVNCRASDLDLDLVNAAVYVLPCIAGHVGADTAAVILDEAPHRSEHVQLVVDVGTNAEIVLGCRDWQFAASSPTGPAFEGAQISCGQRATAGAIERVRIDRETYESRLRVIGSEAWSDEDGFPADQVSGICGSGIIEVIGEMYLSGICDPDGVIDGSLAAKTWRIVPDGRTFSYVMHEHGDTRLLITQNDVRAIQLAKAALRAGIDLLIEHAGIEGVTDVRLAGAFGAHIDPLYALVLGLVPDCPVASVRSVGNAAGAGAIRALVSGQQRAEIEATVRGVTKIETATEPRFQELFVHAMAFPHATAPTPFLAAEIALPTTRSAQATDRGGRRRRRPSESPTGESND
jgi:uncharacterized 2Fe-2S/4Fe-4S cluster protein (DUF4445 family)